MNKALILTIAICLLSIVGITLLIPQPFSMIISMVIGYFAINLYNWLKSKE
jgi:hypothetical protein